MSTRPLFAIGAGAKARSQRIPWCEVEALAQGYSKKAMTSV
jgi:hypothetical protein